MTDQMPEEEPTPTPGEQPQAPHEPRTGEGEGKGEREPRTYEDPVDDASDDSFPASDPPSWSDSTATRNPDSG